MLFDENCKFCPFFSKRDQKYDGQLLQIATAFLYKVRHGLLQIATGITKCDEFITNCDRYYKVRWLLQIATAQGAKTKIKLWSDSSGCKYFIDRRSFFGQRGAPGTFLRLFSPDGVTSTTQAISSTPLDPSWWWWRSVILVEICSCGRP